MPATGHLAGEDLHVGGLFSDQEKNSSNSGQNRTDHSTALELKENNNCSYVHKQIDEWQPLMATWTNCAE